MVILVLLILLDLVDYLLNLLIGTKCNFIFFLILFIFYLFFYFHFHLYFIYLYFSNAGWGHATKLLASLSSFIKFEFAEWIPMPNGSTSKIK